MCRLALFTLLVLLACGATACAPTSRAPPTGAAPGATSGEQATPHDPHATPAPQTQDPAPPVARKSRPEPPLPAVANREAVAGTWVLQQVSSQADLARLTPAVLAPALATPGIRGFCLRVPWKAIDKDFGLLEAGLALARRHEVAYSVRFMAGRHTPARVFEDGCRFYRRGGSNENVPAPLLADGSPNTVFERHYTDLATRLAAWCRERGVRLLHMAWYGQDWAELNHGKEVRALDGYSYANWLTAHARLIDIALARAGPDLAVEFPFSGYGPLTQAAADFADHVVERIGPWDDRFFFQANGWGPKGDWGAPSAATEAAFDRIWAKPVLHGQQAIQPKDFDWSVLYGHLRTNRSTYCEVYAPSFTKKNRASLAKEILAFSEQRPRPPRPDRVKAEPPRPLDRPMVPLMTLTGRMVGPRDANGLSHIARTYRFINAHGHATGPDAPGRPGDLADRLRRIEPRFTLSHYRNGSYVEQGRAEEAAEVESQLPLAISVWNSGLRLRAAFDAAALSVRLAPPARRPTGVPAIWPLRASTTDTDHSCTKHAYVAWLRLGSELLRIDSVEADASGDLRLEVRRGLWGTSAVPHGEGTPVLLPVYIGSVTQGADVALSGVPGSKSKQQGLRYGVQVEHPAFHRWLGDKCAALFGLGFDVVWLDVTSASWYNNSDAYGRPVVPWDVRTGRTVDPGARCVHQQMKLDALFKRFPQGRFFVNNIKGGSYFTGGRVRRLLSGEGGHTPASGGSMELYANTRNERAWRQVLAMTLDFVHSGFEGVAWSKGGGKDPAAYRRFAYATFLLAWEPNSRLMFGGQWGGPARRPDSFLHWDLGEPVDHFKHADDAAYPDAPGIYRRRFTRGLVLVNARPGTCPTVELDAPLHDPDAGRGVAQVQLQPFTAKLLLKTGG